MENKLTWVTFEASDCSKCEGTDAEVLTRSKKYNYIYDGEVARCKICNHSGVVNVSDSECADIDWDD